MATNPVVLITGASRGIGSRLAVEFARAGYKVIINYLKENIQAKNLMSKINLYYDKSARVCRADISDSYSVKKMVNEIKEKEKRLDVLVNNAAITRNRTITKMSQDEWDAVISTDLSGPFYLIRECSKLMMKERQGCVINIASVAGASGLVGSANYAAAKAGLVSLTKTAARELGRFNVRVNAVLPGFHLTDMGNNAAEGYLDKVKQESVLHKTTDIDELARFIVFLSSMQSISGQVFNWDSRIL